MDQLLRNRVGILNDVPITFDHLEEVLIKTAKTIPFENGRILEMAERHFQINID